LGVKDDTSLLKSLGHSLKVEISQGATMGRRVMRFKQAFSLKETEDDSSSDSAESMSIRHMRKFLIEDGFKCMRD